jgi:hypothetical protein
MNLNNIKLTTIILTLLIAVNIGFGGPRNKFGTAAAPELLIPVGSVGTSLSGSNLSSVTGVDAMFWNPAGLGQMNTQKVEVLVSHMQYFGDMNMQYLGAGASLGNLLNIGVGIRSLNIGDIIETTEQMPDGTGTIFKPTYVLANLTLAKQMTDKIRFGTNVKLINENVADVSATGFALDFGLQYKGGNTGFAFGIVIKNLGPSMTFNGSGLDRTVIGVNGQTSVQRVNLQDFDLPTSLELGVSYAANFGKQNTVSFFSSFQNSGFSSDQYRFGAEYNWKSIFYVRGGGIVTPNFKTDESLFGPTLGVGLHYPISGMNLGFDYAYRFINESAFNSTNQYFTLNIGF